MIILFGPSALCRSFVAARFLGKATLSRGQIVGACDHTVFGEG
jgi:hypothetical protein